MVEIDPWTVWMNGLKIPGTNGQNFKITHSESDIVSKQWTDVKVHNRLCWKKEIYNIYVYILMMQDNFYNAVTI